MRFSVWKVLATLGRGLGAGCAGFRLFVRGGCFDLRFNEFEQRPEMDQAHAADSVTLFNAPAEDRGIGPKNQRV